MKVMQYQNGSWTGSGYGRCNAPSSLSGSHQSKHGHNDAQYGYDDSLGRQGGRTEGVGEGGRGRGGREGDEALGQIVGGKGEGEREDRGREEREGGQEREGKREERGREERRGREGRRGRREGGRRGGRKRECKD